MYLVTLLGPELVAVVSPEPAGGSPLAAVTVALVALLTLGLLGVLEFLGVLGARFFGPVSRVGRLLWGDGGMRKPDIVKRR